MKHKARAYIKRIAAISIVAGVSFAAPAFDDPDDDNASKASFPMHEFDMLGSLGKSNTWVGNAADSIGDGSHEFCSSAAHEVYYVLADVTARIKAQKSHLRMISRVSPVRLSGQYQKVSMAQKRLITAEMMLGIYNQRVSMYQNKAELSILSEVSVDKKTKVVLAKAQAAMDEALAVVEAIE